MASEPQAIPDDDRAAARSEVTIPAMLRVSGGRPFATLINDLSLGGFSCVAPVRLEPGMRCWLTLPGLEALGAEAVWWDGGLVGCAFERLLSPIVHDNVVLRYRSGLAAPRVAAKRWLSC